VKDIIIRAGRHIYPHEIEDALGSIPGIIANGVAVFGVKDAITGTERIVILAETAEGEAVRRGALQAAARGAATDILGAPPDEIVLVVPQTIPKTSSGKIRRSAAKEIFEAGKGFEPPPTLRLQMARLALSSAAALVRRTIRLSGALLYATWWWIVIILTSVVGWLVVRLLPRLRWRWASVRALARASLALLGVRVAVSGIDRLPAGNTVLAFNHSSYADGLILAAVLPGTPVFVAKGEFADQLFVGPLLRRLGVAFVERYEAAGSLADTASVIQRARQGQVLVFFPEGTFTRRPGLTGFYLGAFKVASEAGLPVVPAAIRGTRTMLRGEQWFPRWTPVSVHFDDPISPQGQDFAGVVALRDKVRLAVLAHCGEPNLGGLDKPAPLAAAPHRAT
jgi:1-acyl-sn-glycerol-3-phosphate acyltransferase